MPKETVTKEAVLREIIDWFIEHKEAGADAVGDLIKRIMEIQKTDESTTVQVVTVPTYYYEKHSNTDPCLGCSNNPINGGSGICHCILGVPKVMC